MLTIMKIIKLFVCLMAIGVVSCTSPTKKAEVDSIAVEEIPVVEEVSDALSSSNLEKGTGKFLQINESEGYLSELKFKGGKLNISYVKGDASSATLAASYDYEVSESKLILKKDGEVKYEIPIEWEIIKPDGVTTCFAFTVKGDNLPEYFVKGKYWDAQSMTM